MLQFAEVYLGRVRAATSENDIIAILGGLAVELRFRSGYLIRYAKELDGAMLVLDSFFGRDGWWEDYVSSGLRSDTKMAQDLLSHGGIQYLDVRQFPGPDGAMLAFARRVDMVKSAIVPISFDGKAYGLIGFCGEQTLSAAQETALQLISYSLFAQAQAMNEAGVHIAPAALTPREREVMALSAEGFTSQQVADQLGISARTVSQHMDNVAEKLGTKNRVHTVAEAIRRSLL